MLLFPRFPILRNLAYSSGHPPGGHSVTFVISSVSTSLLLVPQSHLLKSFQNSPPLTCYCSYVIIISMDNGNSLLISLHQFFPYSDSPSSTDYKYSFSQSSISRVLQLLGLQSPLQFGLFILTLVHAGQSGILSAF